MRVDANDNYSFELLADFVDGLVDNATAKRIEAKIQEDEHTEAIVDGIRFFYENRLADREGLELYLEDFRKRLASRIGESGMRDDNDEKTPTAAAPIAPDAIKSATESTMDSAPIRRNLKPKKSGPFKIYRVAAAILFLLAAGIVFWQTGSGDRTSKMIEAHLENPYPAPVNVRSGDENDEDVVYVEAAQAYASGDYVQAAAQFRELISAGDERPELAYYAGLSRLFSGDYDKAVESLDDLESWYDAHPSIEPLYLQQARWYKSLALYRSGETSQAQKLLEQIATDESHYRRKEAAELLN